MKIVLPAAVLAVWVLALPLAAQVPDTAIAVPGITVSEIESAIDTQAAIRRLRTLAHDPAPPLAWLFTLYYSGQTGAVDSVRPLFAGKLPKAAADSVQSILLGSARRIVPTGKPVSHTVVALPGEHAAVRPPVEEPPIFLNGNELARALTQFARQHRRNPEARALGDVEVKVRVRIDAAGIPTTVVVPTPSPFPAFDAEALRRAYEMRFEPARLEGEGVAVWIQVPLQVRFR